MSHPADFELLVGTIPHDGGAVNRFIVQAFTPVGVGSAEIELDPDCPAFANSVRVATDEGPGLDQRRVAGKLLFDNLFQGEVRDLWNQTVGLLKGPEHAGKFSRVRLRLWIASPDLARLPWELLVWEKVPLATRPDITVSRYLPGPEPAFFEPVKQIKVLVVVARPQRDPALGEPEVIPEKAVQDLDALLKAKPLIQHRVLKNPDLAEIQTALRQGYNVLHYLGHGDPGRLILINKAGAIQPVPVANLRQLALGRRSLRLVVLNACMSGKMPAQDVFGAVGPAFVQIGIAAAVAMQYSNVTLDTSELFNSRFYQELAEGAALDVAISEARQALSAKFLDQRDWSTPVLYVGTRAASPLPLVASQEDDALARLEQAVGEASFARHALQQLREDFRQLLTRVDQLKALAEVNRSIQEISRQSGMIFPHEGDPAEALDPSRLPEVATGWKALNVMMPVHLDSVRGPGLPAFQPATDAFLSAVAAMRQATQDGALKRIPAAIRTYHEALDGLDVAFRQHLGAVLMDVSDAARRSLGRFE